jgi:hypothetical protein
MLQEYTSTGMMDSDGNCISVLEEILGEKKLKRTFWKKYCSCFRSKKL